MKNPHALIIFGQRYDGSNEVTITPSIATESSAGCVKPVAKTSDMTQDVGVDGSGKLYTKGVQVDSTVTAFSENAVSGNGVYQYGNSLVTQMQSLVNTTKQNIDKEQAVERKKITDSLDTTNAAVGQLKTSVETNTSDISILRTSINQAKQDISGNSSEITEIKQKNENQDTEISGIKTDITNQVKILNDTITKTKSDIEADITSQVSSVNTKADNNAESISTLQSGLDTANGNIATNKNGIATNKSDISGLKTRCTNIEKDVSTNKTSIDGLKTSVASNLASIQVNASDIVELNNKVTSQQAQITTLLARSIGGFFESESALLNWIKSTDNTKNLEVGAGLFVNNDTSLCYIWDGNKAIKFVFLSDVTGGYLTAINPSGTGQIIMNDCTAGSYGAAFGSSNTVRKLYGLASGRGLIVVADGGAAFGKYNATPDDDEMFSVGAGQNDETRQTVHTITESGYSKSTGDVTAFDTGLNAPISADKSKVAVSCSITNKQSNVDVKVDWDSFITIITRNDAGVYNFVYKDGHWSSDSYNFAYIAQQETYYHPIDVVDISFVYNDGTEGKPTITFVDNDTITVHAPLQKTISLRELYNTVSELYQYVHKES